MSETIIEIRDLSRRFGQKLALANVDLDVPQGVVFGLVGENGAGKTTLIRHVMGLLKAASGTVSVFGCDPVANPVAVLSRVGYLSEDRDIPDWMRVDELMEYTSAFFPNWDASFADRLFETFELVRSQKIKSLSRGQRARVGLLTALAHRPDLLVLDEPSSGLDPIVRRDILAAIIRTVAEEGRTVLFSSHLLDEVERVADHVAMIHQGDVVLSDSLDAILSSHHRIALRLPQPQQSAPDLPGAISLTGEGRDWSAVCNGELMLLRQSVGELNAEIVEETRPSLDDVFLARAGD